MTARKLVLPLIAAILASYALAHSPALGLLARLVHSPSRRCYFRCAGWVANGRVVDMAAALALVTVAVVAGWFLSGRTAGKSYERPLVFGLNVLSLTVVPSALLGFAGWLLHVPLLRPPAGPLLAAIPGATIVAIAITRGWRLALPKRPSVRLTGLSAVLAGLAFVLLATSVAISLGHPPTGYDALSYHGPMAVYFWRDGDLGTLLDRTPWAAALAHPGTAELWFGLLRYAGGERVASLGQLPFALLGAAAIYAVARRSGLGDGASRLGAFTFLLAPIVVVQSGMQVNDLAAGALLMVTVALAAAPASEWMPTRSIYVGLALGLTITTKLAMLPAAAAVGLYALVIEGRHRRFKALAAMTAAALLAAAPWWIRNMIMFGNPIYPAALPLVGRGYVVGDFAQKDGWFVPSPIAWPLYPILEPHSEMSGFGALFAALALVGLAVAVMRRRRSQPIRIYGLVIVLSLPAWWMLSQHEPRLLLGVFGLAFAFVGWALLAVPRSQRRAAAWACTAGALFSAAVTVDQSLRPLTGAPNGRAEFYDRVWNVDSVATQLPESEGLLYHTGYARLSYAGDYPLLGPSLGRLLTVIDGPQRTDSVAAIMHRAGVRYAYVPVAPDAVSEVVATYAPPRFEVAHVSTADTDKSRGVRRYLFLLRDR